MSWVRWMVIWPMSWCWGLMVMGLLLRMAFRVLVCWGEMRRVLPLSQSATVVAASLCFLAN